MLARICANTLNSAAQRTYPAATYAGLSPEARRCLAAQLYGECIVRLIAKGEDESRKKEPIARALLGASRAGLPRARRFRDDACFNVHLPGTVSSERIMGEWLPP